MIENHLKMNDSKKESMVFRARYNLDMNTIPSLKAGDSDIITNKNIKSPGSYTGCTPNLQISHN